MRRKGGRLLCRSYVPQVVCLSRISQGYIHMLKSKNVFAGVWGWSAAALSGLITLQQPIIRIHVCSFLRVNFFFLLSVLIMLVVCVCEDVW